VELANEDRERLSAAVAAREDAPALAPAALREAKLRIDDGPTLRARAESTDASGAVIGADLPWLRLGAQISGEVDGQTFQGRIAWVGLDVSAAGIARLQLRLAFDAGRGLGKGERRDITLPYFSTEAARAELNEPAPDPAPAQVAWYEERSRAVSPVTSTAIVVRERPEGTGRAQALVQIGARRRRRLAMLRTAVVLFSLLALFLAARAFLRVAPAALPVAPPAAGPVEPALAEEEPAPSSPVPRSPTPKGGAPRGKKPAKRAR
jgi:hypothetical protein